MEQESFRQGSKDTEFGFVNNHLRIPRIRSFRTASGLEDKERTHLNQSTTYIYIPEVSTTLRFWGRLQNTSFLGTFDTFWGRFMQKMSFIFQAGAGYIH